MTIAISRIPSGDHGLRHRLSAEDARRCDTERPLGSFVRIAVVGTFRADDGTELAYRVRSEGVPLVCSICGALANRLPLRIRRATAVAAWSGGHSLWLDDPEWFVSAVSAFLDDDSAVARC